MTKIDEVAPATSTPTMTTTPAGPTAPGAALPLTSLAPPAAGALSVPVEQLASQAVVSSLVTSTLPFTTAAYTHLTLDQIIALIRQRLDAAQAAGIISPAESSALHDRFDAVRRGERVDRPRSDRRTPPSPVTVAGILAAVTPPETSEDFDLLGFFSDALTVLGDVLTGFAVGGIPGAIIGGVTSYAMLTHEEGFLTR
jgi:hypothetical protein